MNKKGILNENQIKLKVGRGEDTFTYALPCRNCNYPLPLNNIFIKDVEVGKDKETGEQMFYMALQCPTCNIMNTVSIEEWWKLRQDWRNKKSGYTG